MSMAKSYTGAYRRAEVETLSQRELVVQLYRGAERFLSRARDAMLNGEIEPAHNDCQRVVAIFSELLSTLNFEQGGEIAPRLRDLYVFFMSTISESNLHKDPKPIEKILPIIAGLRSAWETIPAEHANTSMIVANDGHALNMHI
jgi:flagellar secretion chaperone FliS